MTFEEITNWLFSQLPNYQTRGKSAYKENLDNISKFIELTRLNHSQIDTIHVGGTNGKGSYACLCFTKIKPQSWSIYITSRF